MLFDKDGTIVDYHRTWDAATGEALRESAHDDSALEIVAALLDYDLEAGSIGPTSPLIAESNDTIAALIGPFVDVERCFEVVERVAVEQVVAAPGAGPTLRRLEADGTALAIVTNDYAEIARKQLDALGFADLFGVVVGCDSGLGAKPEPGIVSGTLDLLGVGPQQATIVGDSDHDLAAGRAAGVSTVLVTNGREPADRTAELADRIITGLTEL